VLPPSPLPSKSIKPRTHLALDRHSNYYTQKLSFVLTIELEGMYRSFHFPWYCSAVFYENPFHYVSSLYPQKEFFPFSRPTVYWTFLFFWAALRLPSFFTPLLVLSRSPYIHTFFFFFCRATSVHNFCKTQYHHGLFLSVDSCLRSPHMPFLLLSLRAPPLFYAARFSPRGLFPDALSIFPEINPFFLLSRRSRFTQEKRTFCHLILWFQCSASRGPGSFFFF